VNWWTWDIIGGEWIPYLYWLISPQHTESMNAILIEAIENWINGN
jgi:hypothetical protein